MTKSAEERLARAEAALCELDLRAQALPGRFGWTTAREAERE